MADSKKLIRKKLPLKKKPQWKTQFNIANLRKHRAMRQERRSMDLMQKIEKLPLTEEVNIPANERKIELIRRRLSSNPQLSRHNRQTLKFRATACAGDIIFTLTQKMLQGEATVAEEKRLAKYLRMRLSGLGHIPKSEIVPMEHLLRTVEGRLIRAKRLQRFEKTAGITNEV